MRDDFLDEVQLRNLWNLALFMGIIVFVVAVAGYWYYDLPYFCRAMYAIIAGLVLPFFGTLTVLLTKDWLRLRRIVREDHKSRGMR